MIEPGQRATLEIVGDGTAEGTTVRLEGEDGQSLGHPTAISLSICVGEQTSATIELADFNVALKVLVEVVSVGKPEPLLEEDLAEDPS